jgi:hypothetical protein
VGIHLAVLDKLLPESVVALRAMPSTPAAIKMGVTGLSRGRRASAVQFELIKKVLQTVGVVVPVEESMIDVLSSFPGLGRSTSTFWSSSSRTRPRQRASREKRLQFWLTRRSSARRIFWTRLDWPVTGRTATPSHEPKGNHGTGHRGSGRGPPRGTFCPGHRPAVTRANEIASGG